MNINLFQENFVQLYELQRDITGFDNLIIPSRQFIRQGCLNKFSTRKGFLQRMFFLVSTFVCKHLHFKSLNKLYLFQKQCVQCFACSLKYKHFACIYCLFLCKYKTLCTLCLIKSPVSIICKNLMFLCINTASDVQYDSCMTISH